MFAFWNNQLKKWQEDNSLVRIVIVEQKKKPLTICGRVILINEVEESFLVYDDDSKNVSSVQLSSIDSMEAF
ncbi:hypothetical protein ACFSCX_06215 [Bacillus salitolerans]|uniref:YolD-like family protein n=1 Tax=Bacillus salitolerans TaxID=1437434 RepID=A0ABW4LM44_9BACI